MSVVAVVRRVFGGRSDNGGYIQAVGPRLLYGDPTKLTACDIASGERAWLYDLPKDSPIHRAYAGMGHSRAMEGMVTVYDGAAVLSVGNGLLAIDLKTGKPLWRYPMAGIITWGPVVRDGIAYFTADSDVEFSEGAIGIMPHYLVRLRRSADPKPATRHVYALDLAKAKQLGVPEEETVEATDRMLR